MSEIKSGIDSEINGQYLQAVKYYAIELENSNNSSIDTYINLAFLYWQFAAELTLTDGYNIPNEWSLIGGERYPVIIEKGLIKYPRNVELHFWKNYFPYRLFGKEFTQENCQELITKYGNSESLVPYFFLYLFDKNKYEAEKALLLKKCEELPTAKHQYIKSILNTKSIVE